jgi:hypothetical protein
MGRDRGSAGELPADLCLAVSGLWIVTGTPVQDAALTGSDAPEEAFRLSVTPRGTVSGFSVGDGLPFEMSGRLDVSSALSLEQRYEDGGQPILWQAKVEHWPGEETARLRNGVYSGAREGSFRAERRWSEEGLLVCDAPATPSPREGSAGPKVPEPAALPPEQSIPRQQIDPTNYVNLRLSFDGDIGGEALEQWASGVTPGCFAGLHNPSNYCFLNAVVQCLRHAPRLANTIIESPASPLASSRARTRDGSGKVGTLLGAFASLLIRMESGVTVGHTEHARQQVRETSPFTSGGAYSLWSYVEMVRYGSSYSSAAMSCPFPSAMVVHPWSTHRVSGICHPSPSFPYQRAAYTARHALCALDRAMHLACIFTGRRCCALTLPPQAATARRRRVSPAAPGSVFTRHPE